MPTTRALRMHRFAAVTCVTLAAAACGPAGELVHESSDLPLASGMRWASVGGEDRLVLGFAVISAAPGTGTPRELRVIDVESGETVPTGFSELVMLADLSLDGGTAFYTTSSSSDEWTLRSYHLATRKRTTLVDGGVVAAIAAPVRIPNVLALPGGQVAYAVNRTQTQPPHEMSRLTRALDPATGKGRDLGPGMPTALSPDGQQLLLWDQYKWRIVSLSSGKLVSTPPGNPNAQGSLLAARLGPSGASALRAYTGQLLLEDLSTGKQRAVWTAEDKDEGPDTRHVALSPDGQRVAFHTARCEKRGWFGRCQETHRAVLLLDLRDGSVEELTSYDNWELGPLAFSRDGRRLAYTAGSGLYVVDLD